MEIPASVEEIDLWGERDDLAPGFAGDLSLVELILSSGTQIRSVHRNPGARTLMTFEDENDVKKRRRQVQLRSAYF
jgi:hypothetical protein